MGVNSLLTGVLVARWLGPKDLGALAVLNVTTAYAVQLGSFGLASANTYFIARDQRTVSAAATNSLIFCGTLGVMLGAMVVLLARSLPEIFGEIPLPVIGLAAAAVPFQLLSLIGLNIFLAAGKITRSNLLDLIGQSAVLVNAILILVVLHRGLKELIAFNSAAAIAVCLLIVGLVVSYIKRTGNPTWRGDADLLRRMMRYGLKVHLQTIASLLLFRIDLLIVKYFRGATEAGVYSVASQVAVLLMLLPGVIGTLLFPRVAEQQDPSGTFACKVTRHAAFVMFMICLATIPAISLLPLLYGAAFNDAVKQALILLPGVYLISVAGVLAQHFSGTGLPLPLPLFWLVALVANTIANFLVVPVYGATGAAVTSSLSYALVFLLITLYFQHRTRSSFGKMYIIGADELRAVLNFRRFFSVS